MEGGIADLEAEKEKIKAHYADKVIPGIIFL